MFISISFSLSVISGMFEKAGPKYVTAFSALGTPQPYRLSGLPDFEDDFLIASITCPAESSG